MKKYILFILLLSISINGYSKKGFTTLITLTTYNPTASQCQGNPLQTADGSIINLQRLKKGSIKWCAISRDLLKTIPLGSIIEIEGYGRYEVKDTMNSRFNHYVDILQDKSKENFKKTKIRIEVIKINKKK